MKTTVNVNREILTLRGKLIKQLVEEAEYKCASCEYEYEAGMAVGCRMCGRGADVCPVCGKKAELIKKPVRENLTLKSVLTAALNAQPERNEKLSYHKRIKRDRLAERIWGAVAEIELDVESEVHMLKTLLQNSGMSTRVISQAVLLLDPDEAKEADGVEDTGENEKKPEAPKACECDAG